MPKEPTYEELERRVKELEKVADERRRTSKVFLASDQKKEAILNSLMEHVVHQDTEMRILWANRAACESVNLPYEEIVGHYCYEIWPKRSDPCSDCPVIKAIEMGQPQVIEKSTPDGRYWFIRGYPLRDRNGDIVGGIEVTLEITELKQAEETVRESEHKYSALVQESPDAIISLANTGNLLSFNPAAERISGLSSEEVIGKHFTKIGVLAKQSIPKALKEFALVITGTKRPPFELTIMNKDKSYFFMEANPRLIKHKGEKAWIQVTFRDITDRKLAAIALIERGKELENKTHELEEVNAALRVLLKHRDEDQQDFEEKIVANVKKLVLPYVEKLNNSRLNDRQMVYLNIIKSNLEDIITPFLHQLSSKYSDLTPNEIQVAGFVKEGKTTKEIAELLNSSTGTIDFHRNNLRKKLGLRNTKTNLRSFLLTLT